MQFVSFLCPFLLMVSWFCLRSWCPARQGRCRCGSERHRILDRPRSGSLFRTVPLCLCDPDVLVRGIRRMRYEDPYGCVWKCRENPIVPNGFADHYPYEKWLYIIGNINPTFSDKPILRQWYITLHRTWTYCPHETGYAMPTCNRLIPGELKLIHVGVVLVKLLDCSPKPWKDSSYWRSMAS